MLSHRDGYGKTLKATSEPSKAYFITQRIIGIVQVLAVVLIIAIPTIIYLLH